ncbi:hypothetical protein ACIU6G_004466 [Escherichia coli]|uniref:Uncharacterized protein n=5 Tax=Escherichia coli TaxID=562 RepID=A0A8T6A1H7_ECOLX|nr:MULTISPECIES: hypothetical protein [Escherichia]EEV6095374.1 hypothetical protein [Escherichia coli]EEZ8979521.1 hypothetical protein [Escherichia coli]EFE7613387.1 hypothetical protein [Escherichia coli]EFK5561583.1 hypothetical protein [Escherichia coli]EFL0170375.1 hypothetical protein [Escherichia coli]
MDKNYGNIILSEASSEVNTIINDNNFDRFLVNSSVSDNSKKLSSYVANDIRINSNKTAVQAGSFFLKKIDDSNNSFESIVIKKQKMTISLLFSEDYVEGEITKTQLYLEGLYKENPFVFREVFQRVWLDLFRNKNTYELRNFICVASCLEYEILGDKADAIILAASVYDDKYVNEAALRAAEGWGNPQLALYLNGIRDFGISWLDNYKKSVIDYLGRMQ